MSRSIDWAFGLLWCAVSATAIFLGGVVAIYAGFFLGGLVGHAIEGTNEGIAGYIVFWTIAPLILSAAVGVAQGWLLRGRLPIARWFGATLGGGVIAAVITVGIGFYDRSVGTDVAPLAVWLGTAIAQRWLLKSFSPRAIGWLIAPIVAGSIALIAPSATFPPIPFTIIPYSVTTAILIVLILQNWRSRGDQQASDFWD